ncbi:PAAR-like protein [uncultured Algibacter sp.]|uniref:PAAR-like protein n=1 Tax=uncultured Algibacter sp. TaxID=298659 RepID=UPI0032169E4F
MHRPRQFVPSGTKIMCTNAPGEAIEIKATNSTVTIYGENWLTTKDNVSGVNFEPFAACSNICKVSCAVIKDEWDIPASDKILSNNKKLLADDSVLQCDIGGKISLMMQCVGDMVDPPNTLDILKETLNSTFKAVIKQVEALTGGVAGTISATVGDIAAPIAGVINSKAVQTALKVGQGYLANAQKLKDNVDKHIETAELNTEGLSEYIEEHVGGAEANVTDLVYDVTDELQQELDALLNNVEDTINQNLNDIKKGINNLGSSVTNANPQFNSLLNFLSETRRADQVVEANSEGPLYHVDENSTSNVSDAHRIDGTKPHNFEIDTSKLNDLQDQLSVQTQEIRDELSTEIAKLEALIERYSLNNYLQRKIDEELERRIEKAKKESEELQTDMDRASTLLSGLGNEYNAFVTGFSNQLIAKFNSKIDPKLVEAQNKLKVANANLTTAAGALNGAKFIAGGFPAGLVVTKAKKKKKKGDGDENAKIGLIGGGQAALTGGPVPTAGVATGVTVEFRPKSNYNGSDYGIDWLRTGDFKGNNGDVWYKNIIGKNSGGVFTQSDAEYTKLYRNEYENIIPHPTKPSDVYIVPTLTLLKNKTAKLTLKLEIINKVPTKIEFKHDSTLFTLNKIEILEPSNKTIGKHTLSNYLEITCDNEFGTDQYIEVFVDGSSDSSGKIKILANNKAHRYKANIVFVEVSTDLTATGIPNVPVLAGRRNELTKYMAQALAKPIFAPANAQLPLQGDVIFNARFSSGGNIDGNNHDLSGTGVDSIMDYLDTKLYSLYDPLGINYRDHYKVYFINESATSRIGNLYGIAYGIPSIKRSVTIYSIGFNDSTLVHELFHAMGLHHSFSSNGKYTFEQLKTDNVMDYSDAQGAASFPVISTWLWQWQALWTNLDPE